MRLLKGLSDRMCCALKPILSKSSRCTSAVSSCADQSAHTPERATQHTHKCNQLGTKAEGAKTCKYENIFLCPLPLEPRSKRGTAELDLKRPQRKQLLCPLPSLFLFQLVFYFISFHLSFKSSLHQRFSMRPNGCRESCSRVNCSVSARLKPADGVACSSACQVTRGQF